MAAELSMKILIDNTAGKVLFAEAGKDVVDFILSFLALPLGTVIDLLSRQAMPGSSIGQLHSSVQSLHESYIDAGGKSFLLHPKASSFPTPNIIKKTLLPEFGDSSDSLLYGTTDCYCYGNVKGKPCSCGFKLDQPLTYVDDNSPKVSDVKVGKAGFVKEGVMYMITDNLGISPIVSTISCIALLNDFNVEDLRSLEHRVVHLGREEGLELLRISLGSTTVLTDLFLRGGDEKSEGRASDLSTTEEVDCLSQCNVSETMATPKLDIMLMVDESSGKVVFAVAGKDVIYFIFSHFTSLVGIMEKLLHKDGLGCCAGNFYNSVQAFNSSKGESDESKKSANDGGPAKGSKEFYLIKDDLEVFPVSSSNALMKELSVEYLGSLKRKVVQIGSKERGELFRLSFKSESVLTDLFNGCGGK